MRLSEFMMRSASLIATNNLQGVEIPMQVSKKLSELDIYYLNNDFKDIKFFESLENVSKRKMIFIGSQKIVEIINRLITECIIGENLELIFKSSEQMSDKLISLIETHKKLLKSFKPESTFPSKEKALSFSFKNICREVMLKNDFVSSLMEKIEKSKFIELLEIYRSFIIEKLVISASEESEKIINMTNLSNKNASERTILKKLKDDVNLLAEEKENELKEKDIIIRKLQAQLENIQKCSDEYIRRTVGESELQCEIEKSERAKKSEKLEKELETEKKQLESAIQRNKIVEQNWRGVGIFAL
ncbi:uncharacterized protein LOC115229519 [Octopus sinensis]|uniref:Dynein regulatory complex protein 10 n=1 Tax=Octopus sinensis TaxID=2607531 RepID=A0A6P7TVA9_9MOLL|nr:uncharacterized protein LOC115229519 [Octopus sinensis]